MRKQKDLAQNRFFCASLSRGIVSFAENLTSDAYQRTSVGDGYQVVIAHAHGYFLEVRAVLEVRFFQLVEEVAQGSELGFHLVEVIRIGGHAHHSGYLHMGEGAPQALVQHRTAFVGAESELCFFLGYVYLQEAGDDASRLGCLLIYLAQ